MADYSKLIALIDEIRNADSFGEWAGGDLQTDAQTPGVREMSYISYNEIVYHLRNAMESCRDDHRRDHRGDRAHSSNLAWDTNVFSYDVTHADEQCILALLDTAFRQERFCEGTVLKALKEGYVLRWLERLAELTEDSN